MRKNDCRNYHEQANSCYYGKCSDCQSYDSRDTIDVITLQELESLDGI